MLESVYGKIEHAAGNEISLSIQNIWSIKIFCPNAAIYALNQSYRIITEMIWKEQGPTLFGFENQEERIFFRSLLKIASIGPKLALSIMNHPREVLLDACRNQNPSELLKIPGIGKKTAQRLISEIEMTAVPQGANTTSLNMELLSALENFGFQKSAIETALSKIDAQDFTHGLKDALKYLRGTHATVRE